MIPWKGLLLVVALIQVNGATSFSINPSCSKSIAGSRLTSFRRKPVLLVPRRQVETHLLATLQWSTPHNVVKKHFRGRRWNLRSLIRRRFSLLKFWKRVRKVVVATALAVILSLSIFVSSASATTGGRMGGSFGPSSSSRSPSPSRSMPSSSGRYYHSSPHRSFGHGRSHTVVYRNSPTVYFGPRHPVVYGVSPLYAIAAGAVLVAVVAASNSDTFRDSKTQSALGPGVSVASLTVAFNVPDRDAPDSILLQLRRLSENALTETRRGVQDLITNVSLLLLRQERSVISAATTYSHFQTVGAAQREFNRLSIQQRSKFDTEAVNKFGGKDMGQVKKPAANDFLPRATAAVVTITVCIEGDQTKLPQIRSLKSLKGALSRLASDVPVEDCLLSGEVLWAPESPTETLSKEDLFADYPDLVVI